jgi:GTP-binding protein Era
MRFGTVAIVGRTNVGKSTFLNAALGEQLAIVSPVAQTTREALLGVAQHGDAQIAFLDTPGLHRPRSELGRRMNATAIEAARSADLLVLMTDVSALKKRKVTSLVNSEDADLVAVLPAEVPCLLVINKVDLVRDKRLLLGMMEQYAKLREFAVVVPVSVAREDGVDRVLHEIAERLPTGEPGYEEDVLTDRGTEYFVREYVREQVLRNAGAEVPHAVAVTVDALEDGEKVLVAKATIHVEKLGQRKILIGQGGERIREIGTAARLRLQELLGKRLHLELFVRITPHWKHTARQLAELGYAAPDDRTLGQALPDAERRPKVAKTTNAAKPTGSRGRARPSTGKPGARGRAGKPGARGRAAKPGESSGRAAASTGGRSKRPATGRAGRPASTRDSGARNPKARESSARTSRSRRKP